MCMTEKPATSLALQCLLVTASPSHYPACADMMVATAEIGAGILGSISGMRSTCASQLDRQSLDHLGQIVQSVCHQALAEQLQQLHTAQQRLQAASQHNESLALSTAGPSTSGTASEQGVERAGCSNDALAAHLRSASAELHTLQQHCASALAVVSAAAAASSAAVASTDDAPIDMPAAGMDRQPGTGLREVGRHALAHHYPTAALDAELGELGREVASAVSAAWERDRHQVASGAMGAGAAGVPAAAAVAKAYIAAALCSSPAAGTLRAPPHATASDGARVMATSTQPAHNSEASAQHLQAFCEAIWAAAPVAPPFAGETVTQAALAQRTALAAAVAEIQQCRGVQHTQGALTWLVSAVAATVRRAHVHAAAGHHVGTRDDAALFADLACLERSASALILPAAAAAAQQALSALGCEESAGLHALKGRVLLIPSPAAPPYCDTRSTAAAAADSGPVAENLQASSGPDARHGSECSFWGGSDASSSRSQLQDQSWRAQKGGESRHFRGPVAEAFAATRQSSVASLSSAGSSSAGLEGDDGEGLDDLQELSDSFQLGASASSEDGEDPIVAVDQVKDSRETGAEISIEPGRAQEVLPDTDEDPAGDKGATTMQPVSDASGSRVHSTRDLVGAQIPLEAGMGAQVEHLAAGTGSAKGPVRESVQAAQGREQTNVAAGAVENGSLHGALDLGGATQHGTRTTLTSSSAADAEEGETRAARPEADNSAPHASLKPQMPAAVAAKQQHGHATVAKPIDTESTSQPHAFESAEQARPAEPCQDDDGAASFCEVLRAPETASTRPDPDTTLHEGSAGSNTSARARTDSGTALQITNPTVSTRRTSSTAAARAAKPQERAELTNTHIAHSSAAAAPDEETPPEQPVISPAASLVPHVVALQPLPAASAGGENAEAKAPEAAERRFAFPMAPDSRVQGGLVSAWTVAGQARLLDAGLQHDVMVYRMVSEALVQVRNSLQLLQ